MLRKSPQEKLSKASGCGAHGCGSVGDPRCGWIAAEVPTAIGGERGLGLELGQLSAWLTAFQAETGTTSRDRESRATHRQSLQYLDALRSYVFFVVRVGTQARRPLVPRQH